MNILVIGNGFDLAHGLPTNYTDFLTFCRIVKKIYITAQSKKRDIEEIEDEIFNSSDIIVSCNIVKFKEFLIQICESLSKFELDEKGEFIGKKVTRMFIEEFVECLKLYNGRNLLIDYFLQKCKYSKNNWIHFEYEISKLIWSLDRDIQNNSKQFVVDTNEIKLTNSYLYDVYITKAGKKRFGNNKEFLTYNFIIKDLLNDLDDLKRALEIYLAKFIKGIAITVESPDIFALEPDRVLSFNYTDTYERIYGKNKNIQYDYIHGKAKTNNAKETNNMVLGIDEYLSKKRKNKDIEFIAFKKFYQRIYNQTGCNYKEWVDLIKDEWKENTKDEKINIRKDISKGKLKNPKIHNLYIFGHSLDVTDKDVLRDLILNNNVHTTIFYPDKEELGKKIANLVKVIGQDELIKRTGGSTKTIEFKQQQDMVPIDSTTK